MTQNEKIQQEIEKTLQSLDGVQRAESNPFLFTRIKARMSKQRSGGWERTFSFVSRPVVALAVVVLVMAINAWSFYGNPTITPAIGEDPVVITNIPEFESEYNSITSTENYEFENNNNQ